MPQPWSDEAIRHLLDASTCPRCGTDALHDRRCLNCGADLRGDIADRLWVASTAAATALQARQKLLDAVPVVPVDAPEPVPVPVPVAAPAAAAPTTVQDAVAAQIATPAVASPAVERSSATVQSVLAVAGAGLFAVAAIVFTIFNPELTDHLLRSAIVGVVGLIFLGAAWLLARRGLQFSAEAVGALGMVFIALDVYALTELAPAGTSGWWFTAIGTFVSAVVMIFVAALARIRSWLLLALAALAFVPAMLGYAGYDSGSGVWPMVLGHLGVAFVVLVLLELAGRLSSRFDSELSVERVTLTVVQLLAVAIVVIQLPFTEAVTTTQHWLAIAGTLAALALLSTLATRHLIAPFWSFVAGGFAVAAISVLPFALALDEPEWYLALVPAAAALALIALGALPTLRTVSRALLTTGVLVMAAVATVTTVLLGIGVVLFRAASVAQASNYEPTDSVGELAIVIGLVAAAIGLAVYAALGARRAGGLAIGFRIAASAAVSLTMLAGLAFASWLEWQTIAQVSIAVGFSLAVALMLLFVPVIRKAPLALRVPAIVGAHLGLVHGALLSWTDSQLTVPAGVAIVAVLFAVAATVRTADHPVHVGVGYAYSLILVARALDLTDQLSTVAVFSITTSIGAVGAIAATLIRRLRPPAWYAVLIVTAVPFLIGVAIVVADRSGWAALSSGLIFLLALTLLLTRRPGLNIGLRAVSAGLLVPTLAVVVTNLAAQFLEQSGSPVALPVIAVIVAGVLPSTALIRAGLVKHGLPEREASVARIWIEGSALLTGVIAVILALVRQAAGLDTSFIVLVVLGLGAAAAAIWGKRRYGWWVAFASFTGALWCIWALQGVTLIEPYLLPPALALAIIGVIVTARGSRGIPLYAVGLAVSLVPVLGILAIVGSGEDSTVPWRAYALLAGAWVLLLIGTLLGRGKRAWMKRLSVLRLPTLVAAIAAGSAGTIQALRFGLALDDLPVNVIGLLVSLAFGVAGAVAAAGAARVLIDDAEPDSRIARSRWMYAPAVAYIAIASWTARPGHFDWVSIWTLWGLMLALLIFMIVIVIRGLRGATDLPPVWFVFALAFVTAIVSWSARDLRVEVFSVPLGLFLLGAGVLVMRGPREAIATGNSWPVGHTGSWRLLGPGIGVLFLASVLASGTDPTIWRAIGVIAAALLSILVGAQLKLAAPFILGIVVLPVENIVVFAVQIVRGVDSIPWWITLAIVGAVLLIIAVTYERRSGADNSVTARLRDLK